MSELWLPTVAHLLPQRNVTPLEIALDLGLEAPVLDIPVPLRDLWRWDTCPTELLPYLAWAMSVDLWDKEWPEERKREIVRDSFKLHRLKGTLGGIKLYTSFVDTAVKRAIVPPEWPFWAPDDQVSLDRWEQSLPQLRIYQRRQRGTARGFYLDHDFTDDEGDVFGAYLEKDGAPDESGLRKVFYKDGVETEIDWLDALNPLEGDPVIASLPGTAVVDHFMLDEDFLDHTFLPDETSAESDVVVIPPFPPEQIRNGWYRVTRATPDFIDDGGGAARGHMYLDDGFFDDGPDNELDGDYLAADEAPYQTYQRWHIYSPGSTPGDPDGWAYWDDFRFGQRPHTAELWLDIPDVAPIDHAYDELDQFLVDTDLSKLWRATDAINLSKSLRDQILVETELLRPPKFGDRRKLGTFKLGQYLPRTH